MSVKVQKRPKARNRKTTQSYSSYYYVNSKNRLYAHQSKIERFFDLILASITVVLLGLLFPFIYLGIKCSSRGPVIFKQKRTGRFDIPFTCYKFRTMHVLSNYNPKNVITDDGETVVVTEKNDPRVFWFGSLLRKTNLDELPQIINILKGDMSLIGPRPYEVSECEYWNNQLDGYHIRYWVKPGLSGLAQVQGYRGGTRDVEKMRKRLDCDIWYVNNRTLLLDIKIIFKTIKQMFYMNTNAH